MLVLFFLALFTFVIGFLFYLLVKDDIKAVYQQQNDKNEFVRKAKAFCKGVFHLIAF